MKFSIYIRILIFSLALSILSLLIVFSFNYFNTQNLLRQNIEVNLKSKSKLVFISIDRFLDERLNDIIDFKKQSIHFKEDTLFNANALNSFLNGNHYYESISFFSPERVRISDSHNKDLGKQYSLKTFWPDLIANSIVTDISPSECRGKDVLHIGTEVRENGILIGYLVARMNTNHIHSIFDFALSKKTDENLRVELINKQGKLLYSNQGFTHRFSKKKYTKTRKNTLLREDETTLKSIHFQSGFDNYKGTDWVLVLTALKKNVFAEMTKQARTSILLIACVLLVVIISSVYFSYRLTKPVLQLTKTALAYSAGDFSYENNVTGNDEFGVLGNTLSNMAENLDQKIKTQIELNDKLNNQFQKEKEQKKQITSSIEYAQRIQQALLPKPSEFKHSHLNHDILFQPRNIVSGDFYFIKNIITSAGEFNIIAAIDCTGHGVPGAFMTLIANNFLNQIVTIELETNPLNIIREMDKRLFELFNRTDATTNVKDGMDISIIAYNVTEQTVHFCGANQRLLHFKDNKLVHEHKGIRSGIGEGRIVNVSLQEESLIKINMEENDMFILYTDGIVDQFGGEQNRKFSKRQLINLIEAKDRNNTEKDLTMIEKQLNNWKKGYQQTDDMLLIAITPTQDKKRKQNKLPTYNLTPSTNISSI